MRQQRPCGHWPVVYCEGWRTIYGGVTPWVYVVNCPKLGVPNHKIFEFSSCSALYIHVYTFQLKEVNCVWDHYIWFEPFIHTSIMIQHTCTHEIINSDDKVYNLCAGEFTWYQKYIILVYILYWWYIHHTHRHTHRQRGTHIMQYWLVWEWVPCHVTFEWESADCQPHGNS